MLFRKMLRDMSRHKTQFLSIFIMAFLAVYIYSGVGGEWLGLRKSADNYYDKTNLADVFLYGSGFSEEDSEAVRNTDHVTAVERRLEIDASAKLDGTPNITLFFVEKNEISSLYLVEGKNFDLNDTEGIWIDKRFADARELSVGDTMEAVYNGFTIEKEIRGLIYSGEYVFDSGGSEMTPDFYTHGYAVLSYKAFPSYDLPVYNTLLVTADESDITRLEENIDHALSGGYSVFLTQENHASVNTFNSEILQHKMMGDIFPVVFFLIALLTMLTTMTRIVTNQRTQIGTLKALGFKKGKIMRHYISYGFWLSLAGALLGIITGPLTLPHLFYPSMSSFYTLPEWTPAFDISFVLAAAILAATCTFVTYLACRKLLRDTPAITLRPKAPKVTTHSALEKTRLWSRFGFNTQWNFRDARRNKIRSIMAIIGVFGCTALLVCAFGMNDTMGDLKEWQYNVLYQFESKLSIEDTADAEQINKLTEELNGELLMEGAVEIKGSGEKKTGTLTVSDNVTLIKFTDDNRNFIELPEDGVMLTSKMAEILDVSLGDEIRWHIYGNEEWVSTTITAINRDPTSQGITLTKNYLEELGFDFTPTSILTSEMASGKYDGVTSIMSISEIVTGWDDFTEAMMLMVYILIAAATILSVVVLYNLGLLSFTEMEREMATLKVMGLKSGKLRSLLLTQNIWFSIIGFVLGIPAGIWLVDIICSSSGESYDFPIKLHLLNLLMSFCITFGLSVFVNLLFSRKIKRLNMVEALKDAE